MVSLAQAFLPKALLPFVTAHRALLEKIIDISVGKMHFSEKLA